MEEKPNPLIHLKMKLGEMEFEIDCREDQVKQVVEKILSTATIYTEKQFSESLKKQQLPRAETCKGIIQKLWQEEWFTKSRSLRDVHTEMRRIGFNYDSTAVAHALRELVRDGILNRSGRPRRYTYLQKRPPKTKNMDFGHT